MRALLVTNPAATTSTPRVREVIVRALACDLDLEVATTQHRGHAQELAKQARREGMGAVLLLGGDGTLNEVINGLLADGPGPDVPEIGVIPGGLANVFVRALGLPSDPVEATGALLEALAHKSTRSVSLGTATYDGQRRWFAINSGVGMDAEIIESMERQRATGRTATPSRYLATSLAQFFAHTDRSAGALGVRRPGVRDVHGVHLAIVQNTSPWTYLGPVPVSPCPRASFDTGLDLFGPRTLAVLPTLRHVRRMVLRRGVRHPGQGVVSLHDQATFTITASRPTPVQVDGEACGTITHVVYDSVPAALRVLV